MRSNAPTVEAYLAELPPDRRSALQAVRQVILDNLDKDFEEGMQYGMIGYYVPHRVYPAGYHCDPRQPLPFACLGNHKNAMSLYIMSLYGDPKRDAAFRAAWAKSGKRLDMGKACIRFKRADDLALDVIAQAIRTVTAKGYAQHCQAALARRKAGPSKAEAKSKRPTKSRAAIKTRK